MIPRRLLSTLFPYTTLFRSSLGGAPASAFAQQSASNNFVGSQMITGNLNIAGAGNGIKFPDGTILTTATNNSGGAGPSSSSLLPAFLPGPLTKAYTAASFVPDSPITVTRISAALKTPPDANCRPTVLRVSATNGNSGQNTSNPAITGQELR